MRVLLIAVVAVVLLGVILSSPYTVDRTEFVYLTQFGRHLATHDGQTDGGLHWKWPWPVQSVLRLDRRLQYFDLPETEVLTRAGRSGDREPGAGDKRTIDRTITVIAYVCWRIPDAAGADRFIRKVGTPDRAKTLLGEQIRSQLAAAISQKQMDDLISDQEGRVEQSMNEIRQQLLDSVKDRAGQDYGIDVVDIRLRRTSHPVQVRQAIFERIVSERNKKASEYRSKGEAEARRIQSEAEARVSDLLNQASAKERELKKQAETEAMDLRFQAYSRDRKFAEDLLAMAKLQQVLGDNKSMLLLSAQHELFRFLKPPGLDNGPPAVKPAIGTSAPREAGKDGGQ